MRKRGVPAKRPEDRFWRKVSIGPGCWEWTAGLFREGYGMFRWDEQRRSTYAHRVAYEFANGSIPPELHIDHLCRNRRCVRPSHLEAVTQAENNRRAIRFNTARRRAAA